jgi:hypothetical protein
LQFYLAEAVFETAHQSGFLLATDVFHGIPHHKTIDLVEPFANTRFVRNNRPDESYSVDSCRRRYIVANIGMSVEIVSTFSFAQKVRIG